eukprot:CAMPEP_0202341118 /NCGR_PEP_ID=MMETSP1126-20121109/2261_1 /ASSEMBLY_ACC=CAM_ASM_000457 /TAXON_ID=3047 /ORGANISM="Dunaliella tertiolecta, Strain CCMP1320" /LENGTH=624 /DNA_ID=CAMNT_0048931911 /DNA_START=143 /DNA_END=2017 /DNA_ORIENTATION=-
MERQPLTGFDGVEGLDDEFSLVYPSAISLKERTQQQRYQKLFWGSVAGNVVALVLAVVALVFALMGSPIKQHIDLDTRDQPSSAREVSRVAFGSCSAYDVRPQPIWENAIIPSAPDAWVWLGDFAYLDDTAVRCSATPSAPECNCTATFMSYPPNQCLAGNLDIARVRMARQVNSPGYRAFLEYMCPGHGDKSQHPAPPQGSSPSVCPRPVLGVYDDHDWGWNNGNRRLPRKTEFKNLFLDALGEPASSPRRNANNGIQTSYSFNQSPKGTPTSESKQIDLFITDGRFYRDPLPCQMRRKSCEAKLAKHAEDLAKGVPPNNYDGKLAWCKDFLVADEQGVNPGGSCCFRDEQRAAWCEQDGSSSHPLFKAACDPTTPEFGTVPLVMSQKGKSGEEGWELRKARASDWDNPAGIWQWLEEDSPICEMLGSQQRVWLEKQLAASTAPLKLVASGSVVFGSVGFKRPDGSVCGGDDWLCYQPAQTSFMHSLGRSGPGCVIILTGDFHFGDIKQVLPGPGKPYSSLLASDKLTRPIYQVMASALTNSTAMGPSALCKGDFEEDLVGLRQPPGGDCTFFAGPNFGMVEVDWESRRAKLQVRDGATGDIAIANDGLRLQIEISLDTCQKI